MKTRILLILFLILNIAITVAGQTQHSIYGILIDNTGSLRIEIDNEIKLAKEIVNTTGMAASYSIFKFATDPTPSKNASITMGIECSADLNLVIKEIESIYTLGGQTTLSDAIKTAAEKVASANPPLCHKFSNRILFLITDGEDRTSILKSDELITFLKQSGIKVYAIGLINNFLDGKGKINKTLQTASKNYLEKITKETGGKAVFPGKKDTASEVINRLHPSEASLSKK